MKRYFWILWALVLVYLFVAFTVYRFKHPELTETQLFLRSVDALLWR